ncbi:MAG: AraC-like ligand-binding domain-containing protein [Pseudohaliea sp.]
MLPEAGNDHPLQRLCVRADKLPPSQHLAAVRLALEGHCEVSPLATPWSLHRDMESWRVDGLLLSRWSMSAARHERSQALADSGGNDWLLLRILQRGQQALCIDDRHHVTATTDTILLTDWSLSWACNSSECDLITVGIPRSRLSASKLLNRKIPALSWERNSAGGRQLATMVELLWQQLPTLDAASAHSVALGFVGFLDGLLGNHPLLLRAQYANTSRLAAMKFLLNEQLPDPELGVNTLCDHFGCSRATIYRLFEREGGVAAFIQRQRLHRCLRELVRGDQQTTASLDTLARHWRIGGVARLKHLLREHFGLDLHDVVAARAAALADRSGASTSLQLQLATAINRAIAEDSNAVTPDYPGPAAARAAPGAR